jgi:putative oxidoreductase
MSEKQGIEWEDLGKLLLRLMVGALMLFHGVSKVIHGIPMIHESLARVHLPDFIAYGVYAGEVLAPILIIIGFLTRISSLVLAFDLVVAILLVRLPAFFTLSRSGGWAMELDFFFLLSALALAMLGPGKLRLARSGGALG